MISDGGDGSTTTAQLKKKATTWREGGDPCLVAGEVTSELKAVEDSRCWAAGGSGRDAGSSHHLRGQVQGERLRGRGQHGRWGPSAAGQPRGGGGHNCNHL